MRPNIVTEGDGFWGVSVPVEWYRGFKLEQTLNGKEVLVYDMSGERPKVVWGEMTSFAGEDGWQKCKEWLDKNQKYSVPHKFWQDDQARWLSQ